MAHSLIIKKFSVTYSGADSPALRDISLSIPAGTRLGLVGNNGSGKSTLAHTVLGIVPQFYGANVDGSIDVGGHSLDNLPIRKRLQYVGYSFQDVQSQILFGTVSDVLGLRQPDTNEELVKLALDLLNLKHLLKRLPDQLSGAHLRVGGPRILGRFEGWSAITKGRFEGPT